MQAVDFEGTNVLIGKGQNQYQALPAMAHGDSMQRLTCCFELSDEEVASVVATRRIYFTTATFGKPFQPILLSTEFPA